MTGKNPLLSPLVGARRKALHYGGSPLRPNGAAHDRSMETARQTA